MKNVSLNILKQLTESDGAPGFENEIRQIFKTMLSAVGEIFQDRMGNIYCRHEGTDPNPIVMLDSHMDEVGFMTQYISSDGFIKFVPLGGWWGHVLLSKRMTIKTCKGDIKGVVAASPPHLLRKEERGKTLNVQQMFIDVGAKDRNEAMGVFGIKPGDPITPDTDFMQMANPDILSAKAFDNRCGCGLTIESMLRLKDKPHPNSVIGVGSVQEEVGVRGASVVAHAVNPDVAIVLEGTPADDMPGASKDASQGALGKGIQIRLFDPTTIINPKLAELTLSVAEKNNINHQVAVRSSGGTNASVIHKHGRGVATIVLGVPARNIHSHVSLIDINDYLAGLELVEKLVMQLDENAVSDIYDV